MQKQAPTLGRLVVIVGFGFSCFGLLLMLWLAFGGAIPLKPKGYRFDLTFAEASQLAAEADVRISGVPVGKVKGVDNQPDGRTRITVEMKPQYVPIPTDTKAILRQKTLLGETYIELTPGSRAGGALPEGGELRADRTQDSVELDEILRALDPKTRLAFRTWQRDQAEAVADRGGDLNAAVGALEPFAQDGREAVRLLNSQTNALQQLVRDAGTTFDALAGQRGQLSGLIRNSNEVFGATARRSAELKAAVRALPTFERESVKTLRRLDRFAQDTRPLVNQLVPAAQEAGPTLRLLADVAPDLNAFVTDLGPAIDAADDGLPATRRILDELAPLLGSFDPALRQLTPLLAFIGAYRDDVRAFLGNTAAATSAWNPGEKGTPARARGERFNYFAVLPSPINIDGLALFPQRPGSPRSNPYPFPGAFRALAQGLGVYDDRSCGRPDPKLDPSTAGLETITDDPQKLLDTIRALSFRGENESVPAPACRKQGTFSTSGGETQFPQVPASGSSTEKPRTP